MNSQQPKKWKLNPEKCMYYPIKTHSQEWYDFRRRGFGASEIGSICQAPGHYTIPAMIIEVKAGIRGENKGVNENTLAGLQLEPIIIERWKYWDGNGKSYIDNINEGNQIRECVAFNGYISNGDYPHLFTSTDALAMPGSPSLTSGEPTQGFPIETKLISYSVSMKWAEGIPPVYVFQINHEMLVMGLDYAEMAVLRTHALGLSFDVYPFQRSDVICEKIINDSRAAWALVEKIKELQKHSLDNPHEASKIEAEIQSLMPIPDDNDKYKEYYSEKFKKEYETVEMPQQVYEFAVQRGYLSLIMKVTEANIDTIDNIIKSEFIKNRAEYFDAGSDGKIRYYKREGGKNYQTDYKGFKAKPTADNIREIEKKTMKFIEDVITMRGKN